MDALLAVAQEPFRTLFAWQSKPACDEEKSWRCGGDTSTGRDLA